MAASRNVAMAAAAGDISAVRQMLDTGADIEVRSPEGMTPLAVSSFWGYADVVSMLLKKGADVNAANRGTLWTPLHCASFQGHGKVIMHLMECKPDLHCKDRQGRTAMDFASALDAVWPFFAAVGCNRTPKHDLIKMDIVKKVSYDDPANFKADLVHFSRPGSAYAMKSSTSQPDSLYSERTQAMASGDVLAGIPEDFSWQQTTPSLTVWNH